MWQKFWQLIYSPANPTMWNQFRLYNVCIREKVGHLSHQTVRGVPTHAALATRKNHDNSN